MNDKRPVNLDIGSIDLPLPALASITHRVTGVFLVAGVAVLMWLLDCSLASEESFNAVKESLDNFIVKLVVWVIMAGLIFHTCAGIKHLIMDMGYGESLEGGVTGAKLVFGITVVLTLLVGALIW